MIFVTRMSPRYYTGASRESDTCRPHDVIIVTGSVKARPETLEEVLRLSLQHVHRSRSEAGCFLHSVHQDVEDAERVVFLEHWADREALLAHFGVAASREFARSVGELAAEPPTIEIYDATAVEI
jgi:quinol monooxygenase YgiN